MSLLLLLIHFDYIIQMIDTGIDFLRIYKHAQYSTASTSAFVHARFGFYFQFQFAWMCAAYAMCVMTLSTYISACTQFTYDFVANYHSNCNIIYRFSLSLFLIFFFLSRRCLCLPFRVMYSTGAYSICTLIGLSTERAVRRSIRETALDSNESVVGLR